MNGDDDGNERLPYNHGDFDLDSGDEILSPILKSKEVYNVYFTLLCAKHYK